MMGSAVALLPVMAHIGPCGPDSTFGYFLLLGGMGGFAIGFLMTASVLGKAAWDVLREKSPHS
jgi:biotin transporter BioY